MNSFGHAWVAAWFSEREPFLLGSMLPDLASALRAPIPTSPHAELAAGVRLHHATDRVFHASDAFQALEHQARSTLSAAGLSKGPRRALAHIGVEFLIDDELGQRCAPDQGAAIEPRAAIDVRAAATARYGAALRFGASATCRSMLHWSNTFDAARFAHLCHRLAASAPASFLAPTAPDRRLAARLIACLAGRPRLELQAHETAALEPWLAGCRPAVARATPSLLTELARALDAPAPILDRLAAAE